VTRPGGPRASSTGRTGGRCPSAGGTWFTPAAIVEAGTARTPSRTYVLFAGPPGARLRLVRRAGGGPSHRFPQARLDAGARRTQAALRGRRASRSPSPPGALHRQVPGDPQGPRTSASSGWAESIERLSFNTAHLRHHGAGERAVRLRVPRPPPREEVAMGEAGAALPGGGWLTPVRAPRLGRDLPGPTAPAEPTVRPRGWPDFDPAPGGGRRAALRGGR